jgi:hypothetical protein
MKLTSQIKKTSAIYAQREVEIVDGFVDLRVFAADR